MREEDMVLGGDPLAHSPGLKANISSTLGRLKDRQKDWCEQRTIETRQQQLTRKSELSWTEAEPRTEISTSYHRADGDRSRKKDKEKKQQPTCNRQAIRRNTELKMIRGTYLQPIGARMEGR